MDSFNINGCILDKYQMDVVLDNSDNLLVVAGAGSGKTLTIVGKIKYLIEQEKVLPNEILCLSFTNDCVNSLKQKLINYNADIITFHKLGLSILKDRNNYKIAANDYLDYISLEFFNGLIFSEKKFMKYVLNYFGYKFFLKKNTEKKYISFLKNNKEKVISFKNLIVKFLKLFKTNNYTISDFLKFKYKNKKERIFLIIVINIYLIYASELNGSCLIDFDDMLIKARDIVEINGVSKKYKYIIIDEYQDTSYIRYLLIKSIIRYTNAKLIAVGDDFQSIYRFSGCDLNIFINFGNYFNNYKIIKLKNTYRNSQQLINIAGSFVMKNKLQIKKELFSEKTNNKPIKICYTKNLKKIINRIDSNIMIISRNNKDIYNYIDSELCFYMDNVLVYKNDMSKVIRFYTVHRSKGLEEENVIVLNVINDDLGFPNKIEDSKTLRFVSIKNNYLFDEERRLFYVALTRTKNNVYLLTQKNNESIFIKEIIRDYEKYIEFI